MVEIISPPDNPIILVFGQLIVVTKFGRGHPYQGLKYWNGGIWLHQWSMSSPYFRDLCASVRPLAIAPGYDQLTVGTWSSRALGLCALDRRSTVCQHQLHGTSYCPTSRTV